MTHVDTFTTALQFTIVTCAACGMPFGITTTNHQRLLREKTLFFCPHGHRQNYIGKTHAQQLRDALLERDGAILHRDRAINERDQVTNDLLDHVTKTKNLKARVRAGTCMTCRRHFANVAAHMKGQHPRGK